MLVVTVRLEPAPWIERPHRPKTERLIEALVEWVEEQDEPFTLGEAWRGAHVFYPTAYQTLLSLRQAGLVVCVNPGRMPPRYVRFDRLEGRRSC